MVSRLDEPLRAYRIADSRHPIFDGTGAATLGGRWNSPGRRVIYASETYAGALLEKLAHTNIGRVPKRQAYVEIEIPAGLEIEILNFAGLGGLGSGGAASKPSVWRRLVRRTAQRRPARAIDYHAGRSKRSHQ